MTSQSSEAHKTATVSEDETVSVRTGRKFFVPHVKESSHEIAYQNMITAVLDQFKWPVTPRRIFSLTYQRDKRRITAKVGEMEQLEHNYEIVAILEASIYVVVTRDRRGAMGPTILVATPEIIEIVEFS